MFTCEMIRDALADLERPSDQAPPLPARLRERTRSCLLEALTLQPHNEVLASVFFLQALALLEQPVERWPRQGRLPEDEADECVAVEPPLSAGPPA